jgi:proteasome assembly chaperone (PAC2) family protein
MQDERRLNKPWLVAVWPGMGHVAISVGYYLMAKLEMHLMAEFSARELFDVDYVEVKNGLIRTGRLPRSRLFVWTDPQGKHDIIVFIGEAQPPSGKYTFCRRLIDFARELGVERVFTFAAMATQMHPEHESRVFGAATDEVGLAELKRLELDLLEKGHIGGLNGILLGSAAEMGMRGTCLLGEMPHIFAQLPFPKASLAVLKVFTMIADIDIDTGELAEQAQALDKQLGDIFSQMKNTLRQQSTVDEGQPLGGFEPPEKQGLSPNDERRIERLFSLAGDDRSKAYELKRELDRLGAFQEYEDRFLDLFKKLE